MNALKRWLVITPEYGVVIPVTDEGLGPTEWGCDVIEIEAETRRDAIVLGVKEMLRGGKGGHGDYERYEWCLTQRSDRCSPFTGVTAELQLDMCLACEGTGETGAAPGESCSACDGTGAVLPVNECRARDGKPLLKLAGEG